MLSDQVAEQITRWRKERGWNRERLSAETKKLGMELSPATLTNIESGRRQDDVRRRTITVDELMVLAAALRVPALHLIAPVGEHQDIEVLPGKYQDAWEAFTTASAFNPSYDSGAFWAPVLAYERHDQAIRRYLHLERKGLSSDDALESVLVSRAFIREKEWRLPKIPPPGTASDDEAEGLRNKVELIEAERGADFYPRFSEPADGDDDLGQLVDD